ncbi:MAG: precorrin-6A reductase, partial [Oscillibacter sp.]|nr:precorrin-6A reductase [Oscillibacter sp.]
VYPGVEGLCGRRDRAEMAALVDGAALCVDATHPYAAEATKNIRAACRDAGVLYRRLLREAGDADTEKEADSGAVIVDSTAEAAAYLTDTAGNILLTNGSRELKRFAGLDPDRLFPRILPEHDSLSACEALGIPHRNVIAMQGPFSRELNEAIIRQYTIRYLVTKDGGKPGGYPEKAEAARNTGVTLVVIRRPVEDGASFQEIAAACGRLLGREA